MDSLHNDQDDVESVYSKVEFSKQLAQSSLISDQDIQRSASQFGNRPITLFDDEQEIHKYTPPSASNKHTDYWAQLVRHLQNENQQLLKALQRTHDSLVKCRQDRAVLEELVMNQKKKTLDQELLHNNNNGRRHHLHHRSNSQHISEPITDQLQDDNEEEEEIEEEQEEMGENEVEENEYWHSRPDMLALIEQVEKRQQRDSRHRDDLAFQKRYLLLANKALEECEKENLNVLERLGLTKAEPIPTPIFKLKACYWTIIAIHRFQLILSTNNK
ncbi:hypothetical protein BJ944DRAFT_270049 [Cunninghamella echinulata]|nr:hypothetical protein BJ944DRAFT_270049 [Cunninghamella echinulata]